MGIENTSFIELSKLLCISKLTSSGDEFRLLRIEFRLKFWPQGDERFGFREPRFEFPNVTGIISPLRFEDADFGA